MKICKLIISTVADGCENTISRMGKVAILNGSILMEYKEENAQVQLTINQNSAKIERVGDYSLRLYLIPNQITEGNIGIAGNEGAISVRTFLVDCKQMEEQVEIHLHYELLFGEEPQMMKLSLMAYMKGCMNDKNE